MYIFFLFIKGVYTNIKQLCKIATIRNQRFQALILLWEARLRDKFNDFLLGISGEMNLILNSRYYYGIQMAPS